MIEIYNIKTCILLFHIFSWIRVQPAWVIDFTIIETGYDGHIVLNSE